MIYVKRRKTNEILINHKLSQRTRDIENEMKLGKQGLLPRLVQIIITETLFVKKKMNL